MLRVSGLLAVQLEGVFVLLELGLSDAGPSLGTALSGSRCWARAALGWDVKSPHPLWAWS